MKPMRYLLAITVAAAMLAAWLFPRALPVLVLTDRIAREEALQRADAFVRVHELPGGTRTAVSFQRDDSLLTFIELAGGGKDSLDALVRGRDVAPFSWSIRRFTPRDVHETQVHLAADGRPLGFERRFAEADRRPAMASDAAQRLAERVLTDWMREQPAAWRLAASSYETRKTSGRVDRTFTFERIDRRIADAPIRFDIVIAGDTPALARRYVAVPQGFSRRYGEMRSANELYSLIAALGILAIVVAGAFAFRRHARDRQLRWRPPLVIGIVLAVMFAGVALNEIPSQWFGYDTATSPLTFQLMLVTGALVIGVTTGLLTAGTLVIAEAATRAAFPHHLDWWALWKHRGTREVAARVLGGYALAAVALAYVVVFYLVTRELLGWWVPSELLDDPNLIATPAPWLAGIAMSLQAAVWEEALFRALPLSLLSLWVGARPHRTLWMAAGVVTTALIFGFAHADYPSWPAYSRGVEIFLDACLWAVVFLRFGLIVTVVAHFLYNATLFGMFAAGGSAPAYRVTGAVVLLAILAPALAVGWRWARQRGLTPAPPDALLGAWRAAPLPATADAPEPRGAPGPLGPRARNAALATIALGAVVVLAVPSRPIRGAPYTVSRARVVDVADSAVASRGVDVADWKRLIGTDRDTTTGWIRFLDQHDAAPLARTLATTYAMPVWWNVRYVRTAGTQSARAEEWHVDIRPDGVPVGVRHIVADSAPGARPLQAEMRQAARTALVAAGLDTTRLVEAKLEETARPARLDATVTYTDTAVRLPAGAAARVWVSLAGTEPSAVRRGIELPEPFLRELRDRMTTGVLVGGSGMLALLALAAIGVVRVLRRSPVLIPERETNRRGVLLGLALGWVVFALAAWNSAPSALAGYDTTEPWTSFLTSRILGGGAAVVVFLLFVAGLWLLMDALRRRVGVPVLPSQPDGTGVRDALLGGTAMGAVFAAVGTLRGLTMSEAGRTPATALGDSLPLLTQALALPESVLALVPAIAIPVLLVVALARGWAQRLALGGLLVVLLASISLGISIETPTVPLVASGLLTVLALTLAIRAWGSLGVAAWVAAALAAEIFGGVRGAMRATNGVDAGAHVIGVVTAAVALAIAYRVGRRIVERRDEAVPA